MLEHLCLPSPFPSPRRDPNPENLYDLPPGGGWGGDRKCTAPPGNQKSSCWLSWCPAFLHHSFDAFLDRCLLDFPSQLGSPKTLKSFTNRCQEAFHLGIRFLIDFWMMFAPATARARFLKSHPSTLTLIFDPMLVPTCSHFSIQNPSKSVPKSTKSIPRGIKKKKDRFWGWIF